MSILNFTVEETNLIAIYKEDTAAATLAKIAAELPDLDDEDIITIAESAHRKLSALTEPEFSALSFTLTDEDEGGVYE
jgi:hypothetical protein